MGGQLCLSVAISIALFALLLLVLSQSSLSEGFAQTSYCANELVEVDGKIHLRNTARAEVPGVNPVVFDNLQGYVEYMEWQRSQGLVCPVLYLKPTQGSTGSVRQQLIVDPADPRQFVSVIDVKGPVLLTDANRNMGVFNSGGYPAFDPGDQNVGEITVLDLAYGKKAPLASS
jgi:hypothetical protein